MLVSIVEIARGKGLVLKSTSRPGQFYTNCPFCGEKKRQGRLYINGTKDVFHCQICLTQGGATKFYSLLHNVSFEEAKEALYPRKSTDGNQPQRRRHPAESLSPDDLKLIGFRSLPRRKPVGMTDKEWWVYRQNTLNFIWNSWQEHLRSLKRIQTELENAQRQKLDGRAHELVHA